MFRASDTSCLSYLVG